LVKKKAKQKFYGVRVPASVVSALEEAVRKGKGMSEGEYIRDAIRRALRKDGLL